MYAEPNRLEACIIDVRSRRKGTCCPHARTADNVDITIKVESCPCRKAANPELKNTDEHLHDGWWFLLMDHTTQRSIEELYGKGNVCVYTWMHMPIPVRMSI